MLCSSMVCFIINYEFHSYIITQFTEHSIITQSTTGILEQDCSPCMQQQHRAYYDLSKTPKTHGNGERNLLSFCTVLDYEYPLILQSNFENSITGHSVTLIKVKAVHTCL